MLLKYQSILQSITGGISLYRSITYYYIRSAWEIINTPLLLTIFIILVPLNFILYFIYIFLLYCGLIFWIIKFILYCKDSNIKEVKPAYKFIHPDTIIKTYIFYLKAQTIYKAYLVSYSIIYKVLIVLLGPKSEEKLPIYKRSMVLLSVFAKGVFWFVIRVLTSLPRAVVVDSYEISKCHTVCKGSFGWIMRDENYAIIKGFRRFFFWISYNTNERALMYLYNQLLPITYKRIFKNGVNNYNFNPNANLIKLINSHEVVITLHKLYNLSPESIYSIRNHFTQNLFIGRTRGVGNSVFHSTIIMCTNQNTAQQVETSIRYSKPFKSDLLNSVLGVNQTSTLRPKKQLLPVSILEFYPHMNVTHTPSQAVFIENGEVRIEFRPYIKSGDLLGLSPQLKSSKDVWHAYNYDYIDWALSVINYPDEVNNLLMSGLDVDLSYDAQNTIRYLTDPRTADLINNLPKKNEILPLVLTKLLLPHQYDIMCSQCKYFMLHDGNVDIDNIDS